MDLSNSSASLTKAELMGWNYITFGYLAGHIRFNVRVSRILNVTGSKQV